MLHSGQNMQIQWFSLILIFPYLPWYSVNIRENLVQRKRLHLHILCTVEQSLLVNLGTLVHSSPLHLQNSLHEVPKPVHFFLQSQVTVYIFSSAKIIYWASIPNLPNSNQITQDSNWCMLLISDLNKLKGHNMI